MCKLKRRAWDVLLKIRCFIFLIKKLSQFPGLIPDIELGLQLCLSFPQQKLWNIEQIVRNRSKSKKVFHRRSKYPFHLLATIIFWMLTWWNRLTVADTRMSINLSKPAKVRLELVTVGRLGRLFCNLLHHHLDLVHRVIFS